MLEEVVPLPAIADFFHCSCTVEETVICTRCLVDHALLCYESGSEYIIDSPSKTIRKFLRFFLVFYIRGSAILQLTWQLLCYRDLYSERRKLSVRCYTVIRIAISLHASNPFPSRGRHSNSSEPKFLLNSTETKSIRLSDFYLSTDNFRNPMM